MKRIVCLGGGPAGLYAAILLRKALPDASIEVYERNRPDDTFGWGVVFSDQTMENFAAADARSHAAIVGDFHHWDDIDDPLCRPALRQRRSWILRHQPQATALDPAGARSGARGPAVLRAGGGLGSRARGRGPHRRGGRRQQQDPPAPRGRVRAGARPAQVPLHLAGDHARPSRHSPSRSSAPSTAGSRSTPTSSAAISPPSSSRRARRPGRRTGSIGSTPRGSIAFCERLFGRYLDGHALQSNANHLRGSAWLNFNRVHLQALARRQGRADRRCRAYGAFLDRLRHQARHGGCHIAEPPHRGGPVDLDAALGALPCGAQPRGAEAAERRAQPHGMVRERRALYAPASGAVRLQSAHRQPAHRSRESEGAGPEVRRELRGLARAARNGVERRRARRCSCPSRCADSTLANRVVVSPMAQYCARGRDAGRLASGALRPPGARRRGAGLHGDDLRLSRGPHHAGMHWPLE